MKAIRSITPFGVYLWVALFSHVVYPSYGLTLQASWGSRSAFLKKVSSLAFMPNDTKSQRGVNDSAAPRLFSSSDPNKEETQGPYTVAYRSLSVPLESFDDVRIPVALWYPTTYDETSSNKLAVYQHAISISRIGQLLVGWDLPKFLQRGYDLAPTLEGNVVVNGDTISLPREPYPVVLLAHGYLGSRFDLSHIAESLTRRGFICVSPEFPESLAASYPRMEGITRAEITKQLMFRSSSNVDKNDGGFLSNEMGIKTSSNAVIGHSLGCGTATNTGDKSWVRVCIAGNPGEREDTLGGDLLFISSVNDGAVSMSRLSASIPRDLVQYNAESLKDYDGNIPRRMSLIFDDETSAPNHISFLSGGVNDAMINLLSPLLPVAQALSIPVLDFDKYSISRDSQATASVVIPLVTSYLQQRMK